MSVRMTVTVGRFLAVVALSLVVPQLMASRCRAQRRAGAAAAHEYVRRGWDGACKASAKGRAGEDDIAKILASDYEYKMISSGRNFPSVNIQTGNLGDICILLHHRVSLDEIKRYFHWPDDELQRRLDVLSKEELIRKDGKLGYVPSFMVITLEDGRRLADSDKSIEKQAARLIISKLPEIKRRYAEVGAFRQFPFQRASLLILSDVLLDNWQIRNVEQRFLRAERPLRNGMRYYYSIQEKTKGQATEAFGIYGNMYSGYGPVSVGLYGNQRQGLNFITLEGSQLEELFGMAETEDGRQFKQRLLEELLALSNDSRYALNERHEKGFERLGLIAGGSLNVPVLSVEDGKKLSEMAGLLTDELVRLLEKHRADLLKSYRRSGYSQEVSFEEYAIWWYHFFYTGVTEDLIARGLIERPANGVFTYLVTQ